MADEPFVFISYCHEGTLKEDVRELVEHLRKHNIRVEYDQGYDPDVPDQGWHVWMEDCIEDAYTVLCICQALDLAAVARVISAFRPSTARKMWLKRWRKSKRL